MAYPIDENRERIGHLCRQFGVRKLDVFGSATGDDFDARRSDIDFVLDFGQGAQPDLFDRYFGLKEALERLLDCKVDLVMASALTNPYFVESVNRTRRPIYARTVAEAA